MAHATTAALLRGLLALHKSLTCLHAISLTTHTEKNALAILHPLFRIISVFFFSCWFTIAEAFKGTIYTHISVIVFAIFLLKKDGKIKEIQFMNGNLCTWKHQIIHPIRATSINVFPLITLPSFSGPHHWALFAHERRSIFRWEAFDGRNKNCDEVRLSKELNEAEPSFYDFSAHPAKLPSSKEDGNNVSLKRSSTHLANFFYFLMNDGTWTERSLVECSRNRNW